MVPTAVTVNRLGLIDAPSTLPPPAAIAARSVAEYDSPSSRRTTAMAFSSSMTFGWRLAKYFAYL